MKNVLLLAVKETEETFQSIMVKDTKLKTIATIRNDGSIKFGETDPLLEEMEFYIFIGKHFYTFFNNLKN